jgi:hypothetical protein
MARYGVKTVARRTHLPLRERIHRVGENILVSLLVFAHNAAALRPDSLSRVRLPIVISRRTLGERFGTGARTFLRSS